MKHRLIMACGSLLVLLANPLSALAQEADREILDARLEGYPSNVTREGGSSALTCPPWCTRWTSPRTASAGRRR